MNRLALSSILGLVCLAATATLARADDVFLRMTGLPGDAALSSSSTNPAASGWVRVDSVTGADGLLQAGATAATFERITVSRTHTPSSPYFVRAAFFGNSAPEATIEVRPAGAAFPLSRLTLKNVFVRKVATSYATNRLPLDLIELEFAAIEWLYQASSSTLPIRTQWTVGKL